MEELGGLLRIPGSSEDRETKLQESSWRERLLYITEGSTCMDIRQYWKPQEEVIPTKKGLYLRPLEYIAVKELLTEIGRALPELDGVVPCYVQSDHMNQLGALRCSECNPNDYQNW